MKNVKLLIWAFFLINISPQLFNSMAGAGDVHRQEKIAQPVVVDDQKQSMKALVSQLRKSSDAASGDSTSYYQGKQERLLEALQMDKPL